VRGRAQALAPPPPGQAGVLSFRFAFSAPISGAALPRPARSVPTKQPSLLLMISPKASVHRSKNSQQSHVGRQWPAIRRAPRPRGGLQSARQAEALALHAAVASASAFPSAAHATAQRKGSEVGTVCGLRRFPLKSTTVTFARQKVARETPLNRLLSPGRVHLREVRGRPLVSVGTLRRWKRLWGGIGR
jgi:hypothetical protein